MTIDETKEKSLERIFSELVMGPESQFEKVSYNESEPNHLTYDKTRALDPMTFVDFVRETQPKKYSALRLKSQETADIKLLDGFQQHVETYGLIAVLKHGFEVLGTKFKAFYPEPEDSTDADATYLFGRNRFFCARQFHYSKRHPRNSIDIMILINGIPLVAIEVKNYFTGQTADDAVTQFCKDRDQSEPLFRLNRRCLVMFAVDNYEAMMTTHLRGMETVFMPFNQGSNGPGVKGHKGNPVLDGTVPTHYLFDEILTRSTLSRILVDYMTFVDAGNKSKVIFPRYHQLHCVTHLVGLTEDEGPGNAYLVQHSAGSGKSNTIAWLAFRLLYLQRNGERMFDSVIICVHRTVLNDQLNSTVSLFEYSKNIVAHVRNSRELRETLENGNKVIVTTIQKFGQFEESFKLRGRNYAVIFDEAHTTSTGRLNEKTKLALGTRELKENEREALEAEYPEEDDMVDAYERIRCEGMQDNMSFYAFTATPTHRTLDAFGKRLPDGSIDAHHHYCMQQAMEEGFICDVLEDYRTCTGYHDMIKRISDSEDPFVDKSKASKILRNIERKNVPVIRKKASIIVDFFHEYVSTDLGGHAKAMIVVEGRDTVLRYRDAIVWASKEAGYDDIRSMVAFSGTLDYEGSQVSEIDFNYLDGKKVKTADMPIVFDGDTFNLMIAADKFQVGFDQPKLTTLFVDKPLSGVEAVQTLSRLNRVIPGIDKHTHVLDFRNSRDSIREAFEPYYLDTVTEEGYDPNYIYDRRMDLERMGVVDRSEVERFTKAFSATDPNALKRIGSLLEPTRNRYLLLPEELQDRFRKLAHSLSSQYRTVTVATNFMDPYFHDLVTFLHYLLKILPVKKDEALPDIESMVSLDHYRLVKTGSGSIKLSEGEPIPNPRPGLAPSGRRKDFLSEIIRKMNERWGLPDFNDADKIAFMNSVTEDAIDSISKTGSLDEYAEWPRDAFNRQFTPLAVDAILRHAVANKEFLDALTSDEGALKAITSDLLDYIHYVSKSKDLDRTVQ